MSDEVFEIPEDTDLNPKPGLGVSYGSKKPKNLAHFLDSPPSERASNDFCGLRNQGATCYLNALIQLYYMSPELRNTILSLPLCKETIEEPSEYITPNSTKYKILLALQKLFSEMQELNIKSLTTEQVTGSFGWQNNQAMIQQDIQEANRVIFDVLERALVGTDFADNIPKFYKGLFVNQIECLSCHSVKEREESFYDLILQVKGFSSIEESLLNMLSFEKLEGSNQYFCEICNGKVNANKGIKIKKFPPVLTFSLNRFEYDFTKEEMKKINDAIKFGLELDISMFADNPEAYANEDDRIYELAGVLIHRGDPYSGHYHAYIRDLLKEADWSKKYDEATGKNKKPAGDEKPGEGKQNGEVKIAEGGAGEQNEAEAKGLEDESTDEEDRNAQEKAIEEIKMDPINDFKVVTEKRSRNRNKNKNKNKKKKKSPYSNFPYQPQPPKNPNQNKQKKQEEEEKEEIFDDTIFDEVAFPIEFANKELSYDWFDFNDSSVNPIPVNRVQIQFGGNSSENAYLLVYRQKSLSKAPDFKKLKLQQYLVRSIVAQNDMYDNIRMAYKDAEDQLEVFVIEPDFLNLEGHTLQEKANIMENGRRIRVRFSDKTEEILKEMKLQETRDFVLVEIQPLANNLIQFRRAVDKSSFEQTISDQKIECWSVWVLFHKNDPILLERVLPSCGPEFIPIRINVRNPPAKDKLVITFQNKALKDFRKEIEEVCGVSFERQKLLLMEGDAPKVLNSKEEDNLEEIKNLGVTDNTDILVKKVDPEESKNQEEVKKNGPSKNGKEDPSKNKPENIRSVNIERDDEVGSVKYYIDLDWTLNELIENIKKKLNISAGSDRRLRRVNGNTLFYEEELSNKLGDLNFTDGIKLKLEKGKIPQLGCLRLKIKIQSKYNKEKLLSNIDITALPNETVLDLKKKVCRELEFPPKEHKLFLTDWLEEAVQPFNKEDRFIRDTPIKDGEVLALRDKDNPIPKDTIKINLYYTKTGFPDDCEYVGIIQGREDQTLFELKTVVLIMPKFAGAQDDIDRIRLREIRKDFFFGQVFRGDDKNLIKLGFESNMSLVAQVLDQPERLNGNAIVLLLRKRLVEYQTYTKYEEFMWEASKEPTIEEFKSAVLGFKGLGIGLEQIELAKYIPDEFRWLQVTKEYIEQDRIAKRAKNTKGKNKKAKITYQELAPTEDNLRESPYFIQDGDIVAYRLEAENVNKNDDFQTAEDEENRRRFEEGKGNDKFEDEKSLRKRNNNLGGFQIYTDF